MRFRLVATLKRLKMTAMCSKVLTGSKKMQCWQNCFFAKRDLLICNSVGISRVYFSREIRIQLLICRER